MPHRVRGKHEFLAPIAEAFQNDDLEVERIVRAVLEVVERHVTSGEADGVKDVLPAAIRELWPARA